MFICRGDVDEDINSESSYSFCEEALRSRSREEESNARPKSSLLSRSRGPKRPDKPLYMPRAARERLSLQNPQEPAGEQELPCPGTTVNTEPCCTTRQENLPIVADCIRSRVAESPVLCNQGLALHKAEPQDWDESVSSFADLTLEEGEKDKEFLSSVPCKDLTEELSLQVSFSYFPTTLNIYVLPVYIIVLTTGVFSIDLYIVFIGLVVVLH